MKDFQSFKLGFAPSAQFPQKGMVIKMKQTGYLGMTALRRGRGALPKPQMLYADMALVDADDESLGEAFKHAVCAFADFTSYADTLNYLMESFDESCELYEPFVWRNAAAAANKTDTLTKAGSESIKSAVEILSCIENRAERRCKRLLQAVLSAPTDRQADILGRCADMGERDIGMFVDSFFEAAYDIEFSYDADENYSLFTARVIEELHGFAAYQNSERAAVHQTR